MISEGSAMDEFFMHRCLELAKLGRGNVAPNPLVGAVLVYNDRIIGEGYHQQFGQAHAEVNCINSVADSDKHLISQSSLYISLEPCAHHGKTPPCVDLIIEHGISKVVIGARDPFKAVDGKGIEKLLSVGIEVVQNVLQDGCMKLNKRFFTFHTRQRPYIILKWAETADRKIASGTNERLLISNELTKRLVHKWRSEEPSILIGTNTALTDDPSLNVRSWKGKSPIRLIIDKKLRLPKSLNLFNRSQPTIIFNTVKHEEQDQLTYYKINADNLISQMLKSCYELNIQSILVEGGTLLLQSFIDAGIWDEARIIVNTSLKAPSGLAAPVLSDAVEVKKEFILTDSITYFANNVNNS